MKKWIVLLVAGFLSNCSSEDSQWHLALRHDNQGVVQTGSVDDLISAVRLGCNIRVAWGARRRADSTRTIEHIASPVWVAVRDGDLVEVQLDNFLINLKVLGEPAAEHPERAPYGGTERAVMWRANLKTDGIFDAVWYDSASGALVTCVLQRYHMSWFMDCKPREAESLF